MNFGHSYRRTSRDPALDAVLYSRSISTVTPLLPICIQEWRIYCWLVPQTQETDVLAQGRMQPAHARAVMSCLLAEDLTPTIVAARRRPRPQREGTNV